MFKGTVENKQFEAIDGRRYTRSDLEDPTRPNHLRPDLVPIDPGVWSAGAHFGLLTPTSRPMRYVETTQDPREPRRAEAPERLRRQVDEAQAAFDALSAERAQVINELVRAEAGIQETTALAYARQIGENEARQKLAEFEVVRVDTEGHLRELDARFPSVRARLSEAQKRVQWWLDDERLRRAGRA